MLPTSAKEPTGLPVHDELYQKDQPTPDEALLKKYEKHQLRQSKRDFDRYMEMQPAEILDISTHEYLPVFERTKIPPKNFSALLEIANNIQPLSIINNRFKPGNKDASEVYRNLDDRLNRLTYQIFFRQREDGSLDAQIRKWYCLLGAETSFAELESYKVRAAILLINSLKFENNSELYSINFGDEEKIEAVEYDKRQLAAELLIDAGYTSAFEHHNTKNLELYINTARSLLHSACFKNEKLLLETPAQRSAAAMLQETANAEIFFRENGYLENNKPKQDHLERLTSPNNNLLYKAFEHTCQLSHFDRQAAGERNELAVRILLEAATNSSQTPSLARGAFEREDRPYEKPALTSTDKTASDVVIYVDNKDDSHDIKMVPLQVKGHYQPLKKRPYRVSIFSLSIYHQFIPTLQTMVGVLKGERPGKPEVAASNMLTIFRMFLKDNPYIRKEDLSVLEKI